MKYGQEDDDTIITEYLDSHLENGTKQKNLDKILDLIDEYVELKETISSKKGGGNNDSSTVNK